MGKRHFRLLTCSPTDAIQALIWNVNSLGKAADWLKGKGWLGNTHENEVSIAPEPLQGLDVRLAERA